MIPADVMEDVKKQIVDHFSDELEEKVSTWDEMIEELEGCQYTIGNFNLNASEFEHFVEEPRLGRLEGVLLGEYIVIPASEYGGRNDALAMVNVDLHANINCAETNGTADVYKKVDTLKPGYLVLIADNDSTDLIMFVIP